ncbi:hypothetical protein HMPREF1634_07245 [Tissierellia bacterium S7-1-4]|nr:hypothetical protein HMPREF1634_07245 [Tissierellia bacterium S7-1-4]
MVKRKARLKYFIIKGGNIMKRGFRILLAIMILFSLAGCKGKKDGDITIDKGDSNKFSEDEIDAAIKVVKDNFSFPGSELKAVRYDEAKSDDVIKDFMKYGAGKGTDIDLNNIIVLFSEFDVSGKNPVLSKGEYKNYSWTLVRPDKDSEWKIEDQGY